MSTHRETRLLGALDVSAMREMVALFEAAFEVDDEPSELPLSDGYLRQLLAGEMFVAVGSFVGGRVVGGVTGYVLPMARKPKCEFYIYDVAVDAAFRRQGIATEMLEELKKHLKARGIDTIFVQADEEDDPAVQLYSRLGKRREVVHFEID